MKKRILASVLALVMALSMVPTALAAEEFTPTDDTPQEEAVCTCEALCTEEAVNADCPVCGGEAGYAACAYTDQEIEASGDTEDLYADGIQPIQNAEGPEINIALKAGSKIKLWTRPNGGNADPANVKELFQGEEIEYDGRQLMKLVLTIPKQDGLAVTGVTPETDGLYPELSVLEEENDHFTYTYYFKENGTYRFDVAYTLNGVSDTKTAEYTVDGLIEIPDITMRAYFHILSDSNEYRGYITKIDLLEGRRYQSETEYQKHEDTEWGTGFDPGSHGGADGFFSYVKDLEGIQYMQTMTQLDFWGSSYYYHKNPIDVESLEPLTRGDYPLTKRFRVTELDTSNTRLKPTAYTSEMLGEILENMPNLSEFVANNVGFHHMESFGKMTGNNLDYLRVPQNGITSLHGLENHTGLTNIIINKNEISDLTPLKDIGKANFWNFLQNNIFDLTPISNVQAGNGDLGFCYQSVYPEPVLVSDQGENYELELPMPIDIDGSLTKVGFARFLVGQKVDQKLNMSADEKDNLLVKYAEDNTKLYPVEVRNGQSFVTIPKQDVPNADTDQAFEGSKMRFWFENDDGSDNRTRGYFNGNVDFTAATVKKPTTCTVTFDKNGGDTEADPKTITVTSGSTVGTLPTAPTRDGYTFKGWNTASDGNGTEFTVDTPVTGDITVYAQWEEEQEQLWYRELYYQFYTADGNSTDDNGAAYNWVQWSHGHGGWAYPDNTVSISHDDFDGDEFDWPALNESGNETLGVHYVFDENYGPHRLSALCKEATKDNPLKIYYRATPHTVTYQYTGEVPAGAPEVPGVVHTAYSAPVTVAADPTMDGYTFSGWTVQSPAGVEIKEGKLTMPNQDVVLVGSWAKVEPLYTVAYTDGVENEVVFADQMTSGLHAGDPTPAFTGVPVREGYTFTGWQPAVTETVTGNAVYVAQWKQDLPEVLYTVRYDLNGGTGESGVDYRPVSVPEGTTVTVKDAPSRRGYTFTGWSDGEDRYRPGDALTVLADVTLTAQWRRNSTGGGETTDDYILHYESNGGTKYKDERYAKNTVVQLDKVPVREGYTFTGWYADEELTDPITKIKMTSDKTVYAGWERSGVPAWLNGEDHFAYIVGYADGTVRPQNTISRAEVATIFFRLLDEDVREENLTTANAFVDVNEGAWFNTAVSTMAALGVIKGRTSATFVPDAPITRAEFAAICARFDDSGIAADSPFTDLSGHWAQEEIERAAALGWVQGYTDGSFLPDAPITRAEAVTMINRVLERLPESEADLLPDMHVWPDNQPGAWYYLAVQEATNSHLFANKGDRYERWLQLTVDPDWTAYQR